MADEAPTAPAASGAPTGRTYQRAQSLAAEGLGRRAVQERLVAEGTDAEAAKLAAMAVFPPESARYGEGDDAADERLVLTDYLRPSVQPNTAISFGLFLMLGGVAAFVYWGFTEAGNGVAILGGALLLVGTPLLAVGLALFRAREQRRAAAIRKSASGSGTGTGTATATALVEGSPPGEPAKPAVPPEG